MREYTFFLYPIITIDARDEAEATDRVIAAIFEAGVGEIPGWLPAPPSFEEKRLWQAAPELLAALEDMLAAVGDDTEIPEGRKEKARAAIAKASPQAQ